jgi:pimeloyl-ACP methyl ester carboxylesterase
MSVSASSFEKERRAVARPIWREALAALDWLALRSSPVYYGLGVPRGNRSAVIVVPGFMGTDHYLYEIYYWLRRIGYKPYLSEIGWNAECPDVLVDRLLETVSKACDETGGKAHLIGHSLGGILSRAAATLSSEQVASVTTLGSPFRGISSHPMVLETAELVRKRILNRAGRRETRPHCYTGHCSCEAVRALQVVFPATIQQTAIYTKSDGIVDWRVCLNEDPRTNFEVTGTHVGLAFNPAVYDLIARRLAATHR